MRQLFFSVCLSCIGLNAFALTEQEYLILNKTYTDNLLEFYKNEDKNNHQLENYKIQKKATENDLKKATSTLAKTLKDLTTAQNELASLKNKQQNKTQLEVDLNNKKQQNLNSINGLNGQISNVNSSLQNVNFTIAQLENEKSLIQQKVNTQKQLVDLAEKHIKDLENEINNLQQKIFWNENSINSLQSQIFSLENQKNFTQDPIQKQLIDNQINSKKNEMQQLKNENNLMQSSISSKQIQVISAKSDLSLAENSLSSLNIQLNGKQNEIDSQTLVQNKLENNLSNLKSQQTNLVKENKSIDKELDILANLPTYIANTEQDIVTLSAQKTQNETSVNTLQSSLASVTANISQLEQTIASDKTTMLASEQNHDIALKDFLQTATSAPIATTELPVGIDSITVTESIAQSKDWSTFKGSSTTLGNSICAASTRVLDNATGVLSELMVVKIVNADNSYSSPFIITTHSMIQDFVTKGQLKTDKSKSILLPILQSPVANEKALITRYSDNAKLISALKADNTAKVEFSIPNSPISVPFSLRGSSAMIKTLDSTCKN